MVAKIGKKIVDLSEFGYEQPVVIRELTLGDASDIAVESQRLMKDGETIPEADLYMMILGKLIESAPFGKDIESLREVPLAVGLYILENCGDMLRPLVKRMSNSSVTNTEVAEHPTQTSQN